MDKKRLTENGHPHEVHHPALVGTSGAKWNVMTQSREEARRPAIRRWRRVIR